MTTTTEPLIAADARPLEYVDDSKAYRAVIQLGARRRWRNLGAGRWERDPENDVNPADEDVRRRRLAYKHVAAVHETGPIAGTTLNGLISAHNDWLRENRERPEVETEQRDGSVTSRSNPRAIMNRMLLVLEFAETDELPVACMQRGELERIERQREIGAIKGATSALSDAVKAFTSAVKGRSDK